MSPDEGVYQRPILRVVFDDSMGDLSGFVARFRRLSVADVLTLMTFGSGSDAEEIEKGIDILGGKLISWNLVDENGDPVPATREGVSQQDIELIEALTSALTRNMRVADSPLERPLNGGRPSPEEAERELSIPMEPLSESPTS